jgi:hypothetical protein
MFLLLLVISQIDFKILVLFGQFRNFKVLNLPNIKIKDEYCKYLLRIMTLNAEIGVFLLLC